eukprot:c18748_g2_i1 orf=127-276(+)
MFDVCLSIVLGIPCILQKVKSDFSLLQQPHGCMDYSDMLYLNIYFYFSS